MRGLKLYIILLNCKLTRSHRSRGAWIEITCSGVGVDTSESHRSRGAWIEMIAKWYPEEISGRIAHAVRGLK